MSLLERIRHGESNIQSLDIGNHHLSDYDPIWLVRAITNCMYVNLHQCRMMESHFITLMNKIINYEINLKHLKITFEFPQLKEMMRDARSFLDKLEILSPWDEKFTVDEEDHVYSGNPQYQNEYIGAVLSDVKTLMPLLVAVLIVML